MTKDGNALQNQQWTSHSGARHRIAPGEPAGRSRFDIITRMVGFINLCYGTDPDVFDPEHQPKLNDKSADVTVNTIAKVATYLDDDVDETITYPKWWHCAGRLAKDATSNLTSRPREQKSYRIKARRTRGGGRACTP
jgi:hypothetical protein